MNNGLMARRRGSLGTTLVLAGALMILSGCPTTPSPFHDPYSGAPPITTASSVGALQEARQQRGLARPFAEEVVWMADGSVTHDPLYFEDGFGDMASDDGHFAWTGADYLNVLAWRARFLLNIALFPVSAVDTPPWCVMASDGRASRRVLWKDHDAAKVAPAPKSAQGCTAPEGTTG